MTDAITRPITPSRDRVAAYQWELGCQHRTHPTNPEYDFCRVEDHDGGWTDLGCAVAVAVARIEAEEVARRVAEMPTYKSSWNDGYRAGRIAANAEMELGL